MPQSWHLERVVVATFPPPVESELDEGRNLLKKTGAGRLIFVPNEVRSFEFLVWG